MTLERIILIGAWISAIFLVIFMTPRNKIREAYVIFSFKQILTWLIGFLVVEYQLLEYPVREFPYAARNSFSFEYFIYPAICVVFNLKFPENKGIIKKTLWYLFFPSWMTVLEILLEKYTDLIRYIAWHWYWSWVTLLATFFLSRLFYLWFIKKQTGGTRTI
ncbi:CBO0543 family protein [Brevibacillus nitrificans]|uniref:CBO0543 family protein n=1 Tax=Brevibacillus nitrificans TaxID=651560 RepID=UPI00260D1761|nr:CBO0543 family protein [Brevibacillus nitrificans]